MDADSQQARFASSMPQGQVPFWASKTALAGATAVTVGTTAWYMHLYGNPLLTEASANTAAEVGLHPAEYPWPNKGWLDTFDHASIRRGYQGEQ